ncbi:nicotinate phosphoribosyltransferase [Buchnera aphidicola (Taiwanaphis decaspermi)]|uniref:nicotinate phosphoribosyltransferase n=1 Tax=Buchnera aphidicola TaxID=9 RepID=UPI0031B891E5
MIKNNKFKIFKNSPILKSILDTDAYKIHMQQAIFYHYYNVSVVAEFICRSNNNLGKFSKYLKNQIKMMEYLSLTKDEYNYISSFSFFKKDYLKWFKKFKYKADQVKISNYCGKLKIKISGPWREVVLWEVPILSIISELVQSIRYPNITPKIAINYLCKKLKYFYEKYDKLDLYKLKLIDFGTRRRFSYDVHLSIIKKLKKNIPWLYGSSNYHFSHLLGIKPLGTQSHEWFQAHQQISAFLSDSQNLALKVWLLQYKNKLNIALTDCINMDSFLKDFNYYYAKKYKGLRHDSGNPFLWGDKAIDHYIKLGVDPKTKILLFSDRLSFDKMIRIYNYFNGKIKLMFGIGTNLTCDIPFVKPLNIVIKLTKCNDKPVAKISDSPGKIFCKDKYFINNLKKAFKI